MEGEDEIGGLRFWNGDPTVRLFEADNRLGAMLLERCEPGTTLRSLSEAEQDPNRSTAQSVMAASRIWAQIPHAISTDGILERGDVGFR